MALLAALSGCLGDVNDGDPSLADAAQSLPATLSAAPNPVGAHGQSYALTGSGFAANAQVTLSIADPVCCTRAAVVAAGDGTMAYAAMTGEVGTYSFAAYEVTGSQEKLVAQTTLTVEAACGDGVCEAGESCSSCPADCGSCPAACGDGTCDGAESCSSCPADCGSCLAACGDGTCDGAESCSSCPADCGTCPAGPVYYVATTGNDSNPGTEASPWRTIQKAANTATAGTTVYIRGGTYSERVAVMRSGTSGNYITFASYPGESVIVDGSGLSFGWGSCLFDLNGMDYVRVAGLTVQNSSNVGIGSQVSYVAGNYTNGANHAVVQDCTTINTQRSGIGFYSGTDITISGCVITDANNTADQEALSLSSVDQFVVGNTEIYAVHKEALDVKVGSRNGVIRDNYFHDLPGVAIYIDAFGRDSYNMEIYDNRIEHCSATYGFGGIVVSNEVPDSGGLRDLDIHGNVVTDSDRGFIMAYNPYPATNVNYHGNTHIGIRVAEAQISNTIATSCSIVDNDFSDKSIVFSYGTGQAGWTISGNY